MIREDIQPEAFEFALSKVTDGLVFERFAQAFLSAVMGHEFLSAGGIKDRGIDGLEHIFAKKGNQRAIYQASIQKDGASKVRSSLKKLRANNVVHDRFTYVTNQVLRDQDLLLDSLLDEYQVQIVLHDLRWFVARANLGHGTQSAYRTYVLSNLHEFQKPGASYAVSDLIQDPRLFVFLRQQWDIWKGKESLDQVLFDALILFALEGTDPDESRFMTRNQVVDEVENLLKHRPPDLEDSIDARLVALTTKPREVHYHPEAGYCLPYETRIGIQERNLVDTALFEQFRSLVSERLEGQLGEERGQVQDALELMESAIHNLFYQQGIEFSNFLISGENPHAFEKSLPDIISRTVDDSSTVRGRREQVKVALLTTVREIVYRGSDEEREFLRRLSQTYTMLFVLQCDPNLATFFHSMASKLDVYVGTSILIPAISEYYLEARHRRHWNLLTGARDRGVHLLVNENILTELIAHIERVAKRYSEEFEPAEAIYLESEAATLYVDEILLRAYYYARIRGQTRDFDDFLDNFISPDFESAREELVEFLRVTFGIEFREDSSLGVEIDPQDEEALYEELKESKSAAIKARSDARLILTLQGLRKKNNESGDVGIFGYRTWWLSKDVNTQKAAVKVFGKDYSKSCYLRPDFLYNYIAMAPGRMDVDSTFEALFPSLMGVNIAYHFPSEVSTEVTERLREFGAKSPGRLSGIVRKLSDKLKMEPAARNRRWVRHFLDDEIKNLEQGR